MAKSNIVTAEPADLSVYDVLSDGIDQIRDAITTNVGSFDLNEFSLPRAINPASTSSRWEIPGIGEESEVLSEVEGIIVFHKESRAYYKKSFDESGGGEPPDCSGQPGHDNVWVGVGDPGGYCAKCPKSQFSKREDGGTNSPGCPLVKMVFLLRPGEIMPTLFNAKSGNYRQVFTYLMNLTLQSKKLAGTTLKAHHCVTKIRISDDKYKNNRPWKKWNLSFVSALPPEARAQMDEFHRFLEPMLRRVELEARDFADEMQEPEF